MYIETVPQYDKHSTDMLHVNDEYGPVGEDHSQVEYNTEIHYKSNSVKMFFFIEEQFGMERMLART